MQDKFADSLFSMNTTLKDYFRTKILKWFEEKAKEALKQIKEKGYGMELRSEGYKNIVRYGISFFEKYCYVKLGGEWLLYILKNMSSKSGVR